MCVYITIRARIQLDSGTTLVRSLGVAKLRPRLGPRAVFQQYLLSPKYNALNVCMRKLMHILNFLSRGREEASGRQGGGRVCNKLIFEGGYYCISCQTICYGLNRWPPALHAITFANFRKKNNI